MFTSAPANTNILATATLLCPTAVLSGVSPPESAMFNPAPAAIKSLAIFILPNEDARCRAVHPSLSCCVQIIWRHVLSEHIHHFLLGDCWRVGCREIMERSSVSLVGLDEVGTVLQKKSHHV